ncbi:MAG: hypothetical protein IJZ51_04475 [Ruminiclostridium sp.]|nr:hypothetical protein [Ruminiclostridium sp.]
MKCDIFIYSRGVEQKDGFKIRTAPDYITDKVIQGCQGLFNIRSRCDVFADETENADEYAWNNTFMFLPIKQHGCCLLIRAVRIESAETGEYIDDFQGRPTWSLEGLCCTYDKLDYFYANIPSMLMWLRSKKKSSLCTMFNEGIISDSVVIPSEFDHNPMVEGALLPTAINIFSEDGHFVKVLDNLSRTISAAPTPFPFFFGTYAGQFLASVGRSYGVKTAFSTLTGETEEPVDRFFEVYRPIRFNKNIKAGERKLYVLRCRFNFDSKHKSEYKWVIYNNKSINSGSEVICSQPQEFNFEKGVSLRELMSQGHSIRNFAENMGWEVPAYNIREIMGSYTFEKED